MKYKWELSFDTSGGKCVILANTIKEIEREWYRLGAKVKFDRKKCKRLS